MTWKNNGAHNGLWFEVVSDKGTVIEVARPENADLLVSILNTLERDAAFGRQCIQDDCEGAWIAATVHLAVRKQRDELLAACEAALNFGSHGDTHEGLSVSEMLRAAIAKATKSTVQP